MADRAGNIEQRPIDFEVFKQRQAYDTKVTNQLSSYGGSQPYNSKRTGYANPTLVHPRFMDVQPSLAPLNVRRIRYHAPGGQEARAMWDPYRIQNSTGLPKAPNSVPIDRIRANPRSRNFYGSLF